MTRKDFTAAPRILIVAQDPWSRDLLAQLLLSVRGDAHVQCCSDGQSALEACRARLPDLVLAEWALPVLDGLSLLRQVRRLRYTAQPKSSGQVGSATASSALPLHARSVPMHLLSFAKGALAAQMREDIKAGRLDERRIAELLGEGPGAAVIGQAVLTPMVQALSQ